MSLVTFLLRYHVYNKTEHREHGLPQLLNDIQKPWNSEALAGTLVNPHKQT